MSDYPMLISNKLHSFRNFILQKYKKSQNRKKVGIILNANLNRGGLVFYNYDLVENVSFIIT